MNTFLVNAGKMNKTQKTISADLRKGVLTFDANIENNGGMILMTWKERDSSEFEEELYLIPGDCTFDKVKECPTGRVFSLNFASTPSKRYFFWIQDSTLSDEYIQTEATRFLGMQIPKENSQSKTQSEPINNSEQLQQLVTSLLKTNKKKDPSLQEIFSDQEILDLCNIPQFQQRLWHTLPMTLRNSGESLLDLIKSPQFKLSLAIFEDALKGGEMNSVILSLGLDPSAGTSFGGIRRLLDAIKQKIKMEEMQKTQQ